MKRLMTLLLAVLLLSATAAYAADPIDLTTYTDEELAILQQQVAEEIRSRQATETPEDAAADFRYASNGREVRIISYIGRGVDACIPDQIDGVPVTQIYEDAFKDKRSLKSLRLPQELVSIGSDAFMWSYALNQVLVMPKTLQTIGSSAFCWSGVTGVVLQSACALNSQAFAFGDDMQFCFIREGAAVELGFYAFQDSSLETIVIPADVTDIHPQAFHGSNNVTVYCPAGSYAERYCQENFIVCNTAEYEAMVAYYEALYPVE